MELSEFITKSINEIMKGVKDASDFSSSIGGVVVPSNTQGNHQNIQWQKDTGRIVEEVRFDLAVTTTNKETGSGGIGVFVGAFGLGMKGEQVGASESVNRLQFKIPVLLPETETSSFKMIRDGNIYYKDSDVEKTNPYCMTCWDVDSKLVNVTLQSAADEFGRMYFSCRNCQNKRQVK